MWIKIRHVPNKEGEMFPRRKSIFQRGEMPSGSSQHMREEWQIGGGTKGEIIVFRGRPNRHWMMVSIQASVSGSICVNSCKFFACFDCVVINHQKRGDCNEHGTVYAISSDFGDRMTTQCLD